MPPCATRRRRRQALKQTTHGIAPPDKNRSDGREQETYGEQGGEDALGREDGLPGLETLLFKGRV